MALTTTWIVTTRQTPFWPMTTETDRIVIETKSVGRGAARLLAIAEMLITLAEAIKVGGATHEMQVLISMGMKEAQRKAS